MATVKRAARAKGDHDGFIDLIGFAPDADIDIPGACSVMNNGVPTLRGWRSAPIMDRASTQAYSTIAYADTAAAGWYFPSITGMVITTKSKIYKQYFNGSTTAVEATGSLSFASGDVIAADVALMGSDLLIAGYGGTIASSSSLSGAFASIAGAPNALHLVVANRFVMALGVGQLDGWHCSARDNALSWTLDPATLCASGRLVDDEYAAINSGVAFGDDVIAFKEKQSYLGSFVPNNAEVWTWRKLPIAKGALYGRTSAPYRQGVLFLSFDNLYYYDGANLTGLMDERMAQWYTRRLVYPQYRASIAVDEVNDLVYITLSLYNSETVLTLSRYTYVCHPPTKRWAEWSREGLAAVFQGPVYTPGSPSVLSPRGGARSVWGIPAAGGANQFPREIAGVATAAAVSQIVTNDFGDAFRDMELTRAALKFTKAPTGSTSPSATGFTRNNLDEALTTLSPVSRATDGLFDVRQNARWHRLQFDITGDWELSGYAVDAALVGVR